MNFLRPLNMLGFPPHQIAWCVPSAVSILTGAPLAAVTERLGAMRLEACEEVSEAEIEEALLMLNEHGRPARKIDLRARYPRHVAGPTIRTFLADRTPEERLTPILVGLHRHVIVAHGAFCADNWTRRPVPASEFPKLGRNVTDAWLVP